ncbi:MAG: YkgJ family cysteine cluster protein [Thermoplasmata archaeon]
MTAPALPELDLTLLRGFQYACRPGCGLCCYAEPRVEPGERTRLLQVAPEMDLVSRSDGRFLRSRPDGGACQFLNGTRCRVWEARPSPCREFPVTVHVGERLQASLVLACPGIDLRTLSDPSVGRERAAPVGFEGELAAVRRRIDAKTLRQLEGARRRRRRIVTVLERSGQWMEEDEVRATLRERPPWPTEEEFPVEEPPAAEEGIELLPMFYAGRSGPLALAEGLGGWEVLELNPEGGRTPPLAVVPPPTRPPEVDSAGRRLLEGYIRYFLERDALFGTVLTDLEPSGGFTVGEEVEAELRAIGALVLSRAEVRRKALGVASGPLTELEMAEGIRATDQDLLDRPTWGDHL